MEYKLDESWSKNIPESTKFLDMLVKSCYLEGASVFQKKVIEEIDEIINFGDYNFDSSESRLLRKVKLLVVTLKAE